MQCGTAQRLPSPPLAMHASSLSVQRLWVAPCSPAGALLGGGKGAAQALTAPVALAGVESSQRLRINQLLNTSGKMGRGAGAGARVHCCDWVEGAVACGANHVGMRGLAGGEEEAAGHSGSAGCDAVPPLPLVHGH